jgi:hypothetical protein
MHSQFPSGVEAHGALREKKQSLDAALHREKEAHAALPLAKARLDEAQRAYDEHTDVDKALTVAAELEVAKVGLRAAEAEVHDASALVKKMKSAVAEIERELGLEAKAGSEAKRGAK